MELKDRIATNNTNGRGYITVNCEGWDIAFAARNDAGYINVKVRYNGFDKFVVFGYLTDSWEVKTTRWCGIKDHNKVAEVKAIVWKLFQGQLGFSYTANPRGKPPGAKSRYTRKDNGDVPPRARSGIANDIAEMEAELHARRIEVDKLRESVARLEDQLARRTAAANQRSKEEQSYYRHDAVRVTIEGKAGKVFNQALGEYRVGEHTSAANSLQKLMRILSV